MEIVEPILWAVCAILVAIAGATWRNAWREIRLSGRPIAPAEPE